jgi:hypothetical protein
MDDGWEALGMLVALCLVVAFGFFVGRGYEREQWQDRACASRCAPRAYVLNGKDCGCVDPAPEGGR